MSRPVRIQLRRVRGWSMPPNTVYVARPSKWGNPYVVGRDVRSAEGAVRMFRRWLDGLLDDAPGDCADLNARDRILADIEQLRGKNLACYCRPGDACHADILLERANA